jgi:hypothetical protein
MCALTKYYLYKTMMYDYLEIISWKYFLLSVFYFDTSEDANKHNIVPSILKFIRDYTLHLSETETIIFSRFLTGR